MVGIVKRKIMIVSGMILIAAGLILLAGGLLVCYMQGQIMDGPGMEYEPEIRSVSYCHGGSSAGELYRIDLCESAFTVTECPAAGCSTSERSYDVGADIYAELADIAERYDVRSWTDLPDARIQALDGSVTSISIWFSDGTAVYASSGNELPEGGWDAINEMVEVFETEIERQG